MSDLTETAKVLVTASRGIFAADAGETTIGKRLLQTAGVKADEEIRRDYREILFTTPGLEEYISGIIMHDETIRQKTQAGQLFAAVLADRGIFPGVKVDQGTLPMTEGSAEKVTRGLEGLDKRLSEYVKMGARFAKWRAVIVIGDNVPTPECVDENARGLAKYAALAQKASLVPVVEPEVVMEGDHTRERCAEVTQMLGQAVFRRLLDEQVDLGGVVYKPNMVLAGRDSSQSLDIDADAQATLDVMKNIVSVAVPGIAFLSGGQEAVLATRRLNQINKLGGNLPWSATFSFERALEEPAMHVWQGKKENTSVVHRVLLHRARMNSLAARGEYKENMEVEL